MSHANGQSFASNDLGTYYDNFDVLELKKSILKKPIMNFINEQRSWVERMAGSTLIDVQPETKPLRHTLNGNSHVFKNAQYVTSCLRLNDSFGRNKKTGH